MCDVSNNISCDFMAWNGYSKESVFIIGNDSSFGRTIVFQNFLNGRNTSTTSLCQIQLFRYSPSLQLR